MSQMQSQLAESRASEVWRALIGLFGGDSVMRKYGKTMPAEWPGTVGSLNPVELNRGMRRLTRSGRDQVPSVPAFLRMCRAVGEDPDESAPAPSLPRLPSAGRVGSDWDTTANIHLLAHITRRTCRRGAKYSYEETQVLVRAKNAWAADMRDQATARPDGQIPIDFQRECWNDYIEAAEREIAASFEEQRASA